ncbi:hypothetical protein C8C83_2997 [Flavobacterium sp. 90]|uniref:hypothetical protein n=1 Tax=unclassified Flavobacterium TaxID=196869 RepID=UPI000EAE63FA|nr:MULTISPECIES: hypothetical protein [unclassified Flavobacterium]RKR11281.1 hypothetical protein C8C82_3307 [Flavobacterium sp. 81]TCK55062.1 hypothetical protein C8C83_2997 [Flavobacterium sp. 90]
MEAIRQILSVEDGSITILPLQNSKSKILKWQIDEVRKRTENFLKDPNKATDIDDFLNEIESDLNLFK